jgi:hypothetical protein
MLELLSNAGKLQSSLRYNYEEISPEHREMVKEAAIDIRQRTKRASDDILAVGQRLVEVKAVLPHGKFEAWAEDEFGMSSRTAQRLMMVAERFATKSDTVTLLGTSILYLLASPSTPDEAIESTVAYAQRSDKPVTKEQTEAIIAAHREPLNETEAQAVIWKGVRLERIRLASDMLVWLARQTFKDFRKMLNPGVVVDDATLSNALATVRGQIQSMADKETPPPPARPTASVVAKAVYMTPEPPPPPQEAVSGEIVEDDDDDVIEEAPPADNHRTVRLRYILSAMREALRLVPEYGDLTGYHSQGLQVKRVLEDAVRNLEGNIVA